MAIVKTHKRTKSSRMQGHKRGTHGWGDRKSHKKSGHRGGFGMAGTGKRADHKKTLILNLYGNSYFGKQGVTSRGTARDMRQRINLFTIEKNLQTFGKKVGDKWEISLPNYKILGTGDVKNKLFITCLEASKSAIEKVKKAGGKIISEKSDDAEE
ncbi:uL15 family ribosomal protein [Candidatus Pacearchaeota archaeon]|jgi:large subunit ribosomal protein L15|nr:uL15 family ribosomal protein [Candidatus Pacearchaeota archaeon]